MEHRKRVKMVLEYSNKYQTEVKGHDDIYGKGKSAEAVGALDASAKYLSCMGLFYYLVCFSFAIDFFTHHRQVGTL